MPAPIVVRPSVLVHGWAVTVRAVRASGPGGQNVNKVASKIELHVDLRGLVGLDYGARARLDALIATSLDAEGRLLVTSQLTRDQHRNLDDAYEKIRVLIARALVRPIPRRKTKPSRAANQRRLDSKAHRSKTKSARQDRD